MWFEQEQVMFGSVLMEWRSVFRIRIRKGRIRSFWVTRIRIGKIPDRDPLSTKRSKAIAVFLNLIWYVLNISILYLQYFLLVTLLFTKVFA